MNTHRYRKPCRTALCEAATVEVHGTEQVARARTHTHTGGWGADKRRGLGGGAVDELLVGLRQSDGQEPEKTN